MAANVYCTGRIESGDQVTLTDCTWKGERFDVGQNAYLPATKPGGFATFDPVQTARNTEAKRTRKPCPRCGGRVALKSGGPAAEGGQR
jgi:hypothetical protein